MTAGDATAGDATVGDATAGEATAGDAKERQRSGRDRVLRVVLVVEQLRRNVPGGIGRYIEGLLQGLGEMAGAGEAVPEVTLYASRAPAGADPLAAYGYAVVSSFWPGPLLTRAWDHGLADVSGGGDVIHALSQAAPPARQAPLVVTVHDTAWRTVPDAFPGRGRRWHEASFRRARRRAARLVVPSSEVAGDVVAAGAEASSIVVIAPGCDHLPEPDGVAARALLESRGVDGPFLLSVGTLEPRKNLARLIDAYERARPRLSVPMPLVVVGPTGWGDAGQPGPGQPGSGHSGSGPVGVVWTGPVDDGTLAALYARAHLLVYVPLTEGFGFPPVEAMGLDTPVVSSPMPSLGGAGLVVDPLGVDDIASALVRAANHEGLRAELVAAGRKRAGALTWAASARAHVRLWESLR
jgi:glycosyltransferase involved in cell wall biosynthesis